MRTDLRLAVRALLGRPLLTIMACFALAVGTGSALLVFTVVNGLLLRALPYARPDRVVIPRAASAEARRTASPLSWGEYADLRATTGVFARLGGADMNYPDLTGVSEPEQLRLGRVSGDFFDALGVQPIIGRTFTADELASNAPVALLDHELWRKHFGGSPSILGQKVLLDGAPFTVVGIMPSVRMGYNEFDGFRPADPKAPAEANRTSRTVQVVGRLADGVAPSVAATLLRDLGTRLAVENPAGNKGWTLTAVPLREFEVGEQRAQVMVLFGATGLVLLVACANVAHLLLARAEQRRRDTAIRTALGARRGRLVRQALVESLLLAAVGTGLGLALAILARPRLLALSPLTPSQREAVTFDGSVLLVTVLAAAVTGLLFGLWPALIGAKANAQEAIRSGGRGTTGAGVWRSRGMLVASEVALACVLVTGAALLARSFRELTQVDRGYDPEHVVRAGLLLPDHLYPTGPAKREFLRRVEEQLRTQPGIEAVGVANFPPNYSGIPARASAGGAEPVAVSWRVATPGFFGTLRIPLLAGRTFDASDTPTAGKVALVSASLATQLFGNADPASAVGREIALATFGPQPEKLRVVGVVGDVRQDGRRGDVAQDVWQPYSQLAFGYVNLLVRSTRLDADAMVPVIRRAVLAVDKQRPIFDYGSFAERAGGDVQAERFATTLMSAFALVAALLAGIGVAGVMALAVAARTREIGIRVALGGTPRDIMRHVLRPGLAFVVAGAMVGIGLATVAARVLAAQLYGVAPRDPLALGGALLLVIGTGALACWLPARRALRVEPAIALRAE
jgi:putative ABC transport system permease protein